jgi:hypothetical protein
MKWRIKNSMDRRKTHFLLIHYFGKWKREKENRERERRREGRK